MRDAIRHQGRTNRFARARRYSSGGVEQADRRDRAGSKKWSLRKAFGRRGGFDHAIRDREQRPNPRSANFTSRGV